MTAGRLYALVGALVWLAVLSALRMPGPAVVVTVIVLLVAAVVLARSCLGRAGTYAVSVVVLVGVVSGWVEHSEEKTILTTPVPMGEVTEVVEMITSPRSGPYASWALARAGDTRRLLHFDTKGQLPDDHLTGISPGDLMQVHGNRRADSGTVLGRAYSGVVDVDAATILARSRLHGLAMTIRGHVVSKVNPGISPSRALLAGFLIGATDDLPDDDLDRLRRSGLSHFVAVSGSNVAMFVGLVFVLSGPMAWAPRRRAVLGIGAVVLFVIVTRFEPSVIRAGTMAGVVFAGRLIGVGLDGFGALGVAVVGSVLIAPGLADDIGFALSALATAGVLAASEVARARGWGGVRSALAITLGAQMAVAPLLVGTFGSVPVAAPVANLLAAPLVTVSTLVGAIGVITGLEPMISTAAGIADVVLGVASVTSQMGQLGPITVAVLATLSLLWWRAPRLRRVVPVGLVVVATVLTIGSQPIAGPVMVALDVGQGDAILIVGAEGETILVDGGPDGDLVLERLGDHGIDNIDLVVASHVHADHVTGLVTVVQRLGVGEVWLPTPPHTTPAYERLLGAVAEAGVAHHRPHPRSVMSLGTIRIEVLGPKRRYASPNDQSLVLSVTAGTRGLLLTGDVEVVAQEELPGLTADILKVPHQGAATSDPEWLQSIGAEVAVISVGPNDFGHPSPDVIDALRAGGATVRRTDIEGDVVIPLR